MKFLRLFVLPILFLQIFLLPLSVFAQDDISSTDSGKPVDSYSLFWPVSAGNTMGDSLYGLKLFKESLGELFSFGDLKKAEYNVTLSEKRVVEAEKLFLKSKDYQNGAKTLEQAKIKHKNALKYIKGAEKNNNSADKAKGIFISSLSNQEKLLTYLGTQVPDGQKMLFEDMIKNIDSLLSEIR